MSNEKNLRGKELLSKVMDHIIAMAEGEGFGGRADSAGGWDQGSWGMVNPKELPMTPPRPDLGACAPPPYHHRSDDGEWFGVSEYSRGLMEEGSCGTAMCLAGHAVLFGGDELVLRAFGPDGFQADVFPLVDGQVVTIRKRATELLEIDEDTADKLFDGDNVLEELEAMVEEIMACGNLDRLERDEDDRLFFTDDEDEEEGDQ